jgi:hypothetical protein
VELKKGFARKKIVGRDLVEKRGLLVFLGSALFSASKD